MTGRKSDRSFWRIAVASFALMTLVNFFPMLQGRIPFPKDLVLVSKAFDSVGRPPRERLAQLGDLITMFYPFRAFTNETVRSGTLPLWNPHIMSGSPFQANSQSAMFYPPHVVYYLLPLDAAWTASFALRVFLAGLFMTLFVRSIGGSAAGSIVSGTIFAFCGFITQWQGQASGDAAIWLPLICYGVHRIRRDPSGRSIAVAAFAFAMPVLAGHPETGLHSTLTATAFALTVWGFDAGFLKRFVIVGLLALGLASIQMIPTLQWLGEMGTKYDVAWPTFDLHQGQGFFSRDIFSDPSSAGIAVPEGASYAGMLGLLAASLAILHPARRYVFFFIAIAAVATAIAFGIEPMRWIVAHLPVIKSIKNGRLTLVADFAIAALAGLGISVAAEGRSSRRMIVLVLAFLVTSFGIFEVYRATGEPVAFMLGPWGSAVFLIAAAFLLIAAILGKIRARPFSFVACVLAAIEMVSFSYGYFGFSSRPLFPNAPVVEYLRNQGDLDNFRVAKQDYPVPINSGIIYGFDTADGYELTTKRAREFYSGLSEQRDDGLFMRVDGIAQSGDRRLDMLNVKYLIVDRPGTAFDAVTGRPDRFTPAFTDAGVAVFENRFVLPRVMVVPSSGIEVIQDSAARMVRLKQASFDPARSVVFSEQPTERLEAAAAPLQARAEIVSRNSNDFTVRAEISQTAVVVVSQIYYPGWKAFLGEQEIPIYELNHALTGFIVPPGNHEIHLYFRPRVFQIGAFASLLSLIIAIVITRTSGAAARRPAS